MFLHIHNKYAILKIHNSTLVSGKHQQNEIYFNIYLKYEIFTIEE